MLPELEKKKLMLQGTVDTKDTKHFTQIGHIDVNMN